MNTYFPPTVTLKIYDRETKSIVDFEISEFTFGNRVQFLKVISECFIELAGKIDLQNANTVAVIIALIEVAGERLGNVYKMILGKDIEWIRVNLTLKNEVELLSAVLEVNDIPFLLAQVQKIIQKVKS